MACRDPSGFGWEGWPAMDFGGPSTGYAQAKRKPYSGGPRSSSPAGFFFFLSALAVADAA
ncbi:hypothetical protein MishRS11D_41270 [Methylomagnum ishizawai]|nr:hypothetical protein MishRS11D_41270 [Methylomagnum ishizawai]